MDDHFCNQPEELGAVFMKGWPRTLGKLSKLSGMGHNRAYTSHHCATIGSLVPALGAFHFHNHPCAVSAGPWALSWKHLSLKVAFFFLVWILTDRFPRFIENPADNILDGSFRIAKHGGVFNSCFRNSFSDWRNRSIDMCIITVYQFNPLKCKGSYKVALLS